MFETWPDLIVGALAGPLAIAGAAKLSATSSRLSWPFDKGVLTVPHGPKLVGTAELAMAAAMVAVPGGAAAGLGMGTYACLAAVAAALRGQTCACFGRARLAAVTRRHVAGNVIGGVAAALALAGGPGAQPLLRASVAAVTAAATAGVLLVMDRRASRVADGTPVCTDQVSAVRLYTTAGCPSCRSLNTLVAALEPARRDLVTTTVLAADETAPPPLTADMGVPAAYAVNADGEPVCAPVSGVGAVKNLIDSITVSAKARTKVPDGR